ncbi:MAG: FAD/NAD(P)-binding protein [Asticcacaulis sp.]|uniref:FAD/NAD(P)-binding protein n=1 Tax=Asticcacaulis sp. TaxID=1872648 RepID=UPI0039E474A9
MPADTVAYSESHTVIIGGGFAGSLLALKLAMSGIRPILIEQRAHSGGGLAYGDSARNHVLNVPAGRMDVGLTLGFVDWLETFPTETAEAVAEAGELALAFVPRVLFGRYMQAQVAAAVEAGHVQRMRGEVSGLSKTAAGHEVKLADGRHLKAEKVVLATGNPPPRAPDVRDENGACLADAPGFVPDPWGPEALQNLAPQAPVLLIGTGLTMVDMALALAEQGHAGPIFVLSRRGVLPLPHEVGGAWPSFLEASAGRSPLEIMKRLRQEARAAVAQGVPWQRVLDAARPQVAQVWAAWTRKERSRFLRHARSFWDVHRHRLAPRIAQAFQSLVERGQVVLLSGRLNRFAIQDKRLSIVYAIRGRRETGTISVARVINCTGPRTDFATVGTPLFADLRRQGLIRPDELGLGLETDDVRVINANGTASNSLFAIGNLTRPAAWEVTAVPEIAAQVSRLVTIITQAAPREMESNRLLRAFLDQGDGI